MLNLFSIPVLPLLLASRRRTSFRHYVFLLPEPEAEVLSGLRSLRVPPCLLVGLSPLSASGPDAQAQPRWLARQYRVPEASRGRRGSSESSARSARAGAGPGSVWGGGRTLSSSAVRLSSEAVKTTFLAFLPREKHSRCPGTWPQRPLLTDLAIAVRPGEHWPEMPGRGQPLLKLDE